MSNIYIVNENDNIPKNNTMTMCSTGTIIGATVSAIVYSAISTTGDVTASITRTGIGVTGEIVAKGVEYVVGPIVGDTIRVFSTATGAVVEPTIKTTSRTTAAGLSILAGASAALTTSIAIYGAKELFTYLEKYTEGYKRKLAQQVQYPVEMDDTDANECLLVLEESEMVPECLMLTDGREILLKDVEIDANLVEPS